MNKKLIRLTESDLHKIVKESVNKVLNEVQLNELDPRTYASAREKQKERNRQYNDQMKDYNSQNWFYRMRNKAPEKPKGYDDRASQFNDAAVNSFNNQYRSDPDNVKLKGHNHQTLYDDGKLSQTRWNPDGSNVHTIYDFHANNNLDPDTKWTTPTDSAYGVKSISYNGEKPIKRRMGYDDTHDKYGTYFEKGRKIASDMAYGGGRYEKGKGWQ